MKESKLLMLLLLSVILLSACTLGEYTLPQGPGPSVNGDIVQAVQFGSLEAVKEAVEGGGDVNAVFETTMYSVAPREISLLGYAQQEAGSCGYSQIAAYLLEQGADLNYLGPSGEAPLMGAAAHNNLTLCEDYLQRGADINLRSAAGWTALDAAAYRDAPEAIQFLLSKGASLTPESLQLAMEHHSYRSANVLAKELKAREIDTGLSPILLAAVTGDSQNVIQRCKSGELTQEEQVEVGYYTAAFCSAEALDACVAHGFAICQPEKTYDPIETAAECGNLATVQYIMEQRQEDITGSSAQYALHLAAARDDVEMTTYLLQAKADRSGAVTSAAEEGSLRTLKLLLETPPSQNDLEDALCRAAYCDQLESMKLLLPAGEWSLNTLNAAWEDSRTVEERKLCVSYGAKPKDLDFWLSIATEHGELEMVTYLLSVGADPTAEIEQISYVLESAVRNGFYDIAELLIKYGANVNYINVENADCSIFHIAAMSSTNLTRLLVEHGADVNVQTTQGDTPLMYAVESGKSATVAVLLQAGADASIQNKDGKTAKDLAQQSGDEEMKALFS